MNAAGRRSADATTYRPCTADDFARILMIINAAAEAYRGVIPPDRWHEPYMSSEHLRSEIADGVVFTGCQVGDELVGVMGAQRRHDVVLVRHAYVLPAHQGSGLDAMLLSHLCADQHLPILIGTWSAADWAIRFYERHGFRQVDREIVPLLLRRYWRIPGRQIETSIVLSSVPITCESIMNFADSTD